MGRYYVRHLRELNNEAQSRFERLLAAIQYPPNKCNDESVIVDAAKVRLAVSDFKSILAVIGALK